MQHYLSNLIPRIKQFSLDLDRKEVFVDVPWVIIDEQQNLQKYIFKRNGELLMSLNGQVTVGKWEYLSAAKSLLINRIADKILLNQNFIDASVMVLKKDGLRVENFILANEILLPDLDVVRYLKNLYYQKNNIRVGLMKNGEPLEFNNFQGFFYGSRVTIDGEPVPNGVVELAKSEKKLVIENSIIIKVIVRQSYDTNYGKIFIEQLENLSPMKGDFVFTEGDVHAPNGKYKIGFMQHIIVENGRIIK